MSKIVEAALVASMLVMIDERDKWDGTCDVFDQAIELCQKALKEIT